MMNNVNMDNYNPIENIPTDGYDGFTGGQIAEASFQSQRSFDGLMKALKLFQTKERVRMREQRMNKSTQSTTTTKDVIDVYYDPVIRNRVVKEAPFLAWLEYNNRVQSINSAFYSWRRGAAKNTARFIGELENIPEYQGKDWDMLGKRMTTLVYPMSTGIMAQMANQNVNLVLDEIQEGYLEMAKVKESAILRPTPGLDRATYWDNFFETSTVQRNNNNQNITIDAVNEVCDQIFHNNGTVDCIVTTDQIVRQLVSEMEEKRMTVNTFMYMPGGWATMFFTQAGPVPLIRTRNAQTSATVGNLFVVTNQAVTVPQLMDVSHFDLPALNLAYNTTLANFVCCGLTEPQKVGVIHNIRQRNMVQTVTSVDDDEAVPLFDDDTTPDKKKE